MVVLVEFSCFLVFDYLASRNQEYKCLKMGDAGRNPAKIRPKLSHFFGLDNGMPAWVRDRDF
jgi:hypothetical protein